MGEKEESILERLEALRRRVPEEKAPRKIPEERRKRLARLVGVLIIGIFILSIFFIAYSFFVKPAKEEVEVKKLTLSQAKTQKIKAINAAFATLPYEYISAKGELINRVNRATTIPEVEGVDYSTPATNAWRTYTLVKLEELAKKTENIEMEVGKDVYRGLAMIQQKINLLSYGELRGVVLREVRIEYVPIRLSREQAAMGVVEPGDTVNIYFKNRTSIELLAKDARIMAILRGKSSGEINLAESERRSDTGGGVEGYGTTPSLGIGSTTATLTGSYEGSTGLKIRQTETTYTVDVEEIQKAAAASKLEEGYIEEMLGNYGLKLNKIERETNIGDLDVEYLILFEVSDKEAPELILRALSSEDRKNIFVTISESSQWMKAVK